MGVITTYSINGETRKEIKALKKRAARRVTALADVKRGSENTGYVAVGENRSNSIIAGNHRIIFSLEEQPIGLYKHLSVSCQSLTDGKIELPHPNVVSMILKEFGFKNTDPLTEPSDDFAVWVEAAGKGIKAINAIERDAIGIEYLEKEDIDMVITMR